MENIEKIKITEFLNSMEKRREELLDDWKEALDKVEFLFSIIKENMRETLEISEKYKINNKEKEEITWN